MMESPKAIELGQIPDQESNEKQPLTDPEKPKSDPEEAKPDDPEYIENVENVAKFQLAPFQSQQSFE